MSEPLHPRALPADIARVAHHLINDKQWTRKMAARVLASIARKLNIENGNPWNDQDLNALLGDAAELEPHGCGCLSCLLNGLYKGTEHHREFPGRR